MRRWYTLLLFVALRAWALPPDLYPLSNLSTQEETPFTAYVAANDDDPEITFSAVCSAPEVVITVDQPAEWHDAYLQITPGPDYYGVSTVTVTVTDPGGGSDQGTFTLTVYNVNDPPYAFDLTTPAQHESVESVPIVFTWEPGDDPDPDADFYYSVYFDDDSIMVANHYSEIASWILTPSTQHTSPLPHPGPWFWRVRTWDSQEWGVDSPVQRFRYTPPPMQFTGGNRSGPEDLPISFSGHSTSPFGQLEYTVSHAVQSDTPGLAVAIEEPLEWNDWEITCTPTPNWNGTAQLTITATDEGGGVSVEVIGITITPVNDLPSTPILQSPANAGYVFTPEATLQWSPSTDVDAGATISYNVYMALSPTNMGQPANLQGNTTATSFGLEPVGYGPWYWGITALDGQGGTRNSAIRSFIVDLPPTIDGVANPEMNEDTTLELTYNNPEDYYTTLAWSVGCDVPQVNMQVADSLDMLRVLSFTPDPNWHGSAPYYLMVTDGHGHSATLNGQLTVHPVNDAPTAQGFSMDTNEDTPVVLPFSGSDIDGDSLAWQVQGMQHGTVEAGVYTPAADYTGNDLFQYRAWDGELGSPWVDALVTVQPVNDAPQLDLPATVSFAEDDSLLLDLTPFLGDVDGDSLALSLEAPQDLLAWIEGVTLHLHAPADWNGSETLVLVADDLATRLTTSDTLQVIVTPVNDAPIAHPQELQTLEETPLMLTFVGTDADGDMLAFTVSAGPFSGTLANDLYTPAADFFGADSLSFVVDDGMVQSAPAWIRITVLNQDDCPVQIQPFVSPNAAEPDQESVFFFTPDWLISHFSDPDGDPLTAPESSVTVPANGWGDFPVAWQVSAGGCTLEGVFQLSVRPLNDAPVFQFCGLDCDEITDLEAFAAAWSAAGLTLHDVDGDSLSVTWFVENQPICTQALDSAATCLEFCLDLAPYIADPQNISVHVEIADDSTTVNPGGADCAWFLDLLALDEAALPTRFHLEPNRPNPFNPSTTIVFGLPREQRVRADVYNLRGQRVSVLHDGPLPAGTHHLVWQAGDAASGMYVLVLSADDAIKRQKMLLLR